MAKIISVLNSKGGCGKTSTAVHTAGALASKGFQVHLIDTDDTQGATLWSSKGDGFDFGVTPVTMGRKSVRDFKTEILNAVDGADYVFIDTPPQLDEVSRVVVLFSDMALIPLSPSELDFWGAEAAIAYVKDAQDVRDGKPNVACVPSRVSDTILSRAIFDALSAHDVLISESIRNRIAVAEAVSAGQTLAQYAPNSPSAKEFEKLAELVLNLTGAIQ